MKNAEKIAKQLLQIATTKGFDLNLPPAKELPAIK